MIKVINFKFILLSNMDFNKFNKFGNVQFDCDSKGIEYENEIENDIKNEKGKDLDKTNEKII